LDFAYSPAVLERRAASIDSTDRPVPDVASSDATALHMHILRESERA
jgi:hypothetical protein